MIRIRSLFGVLAAAGSLALLVPNMQAADASATDSNASNASGDSNVPTDPNHLLTPQDALRVQVFEEDEISSQCDHLEVSQDYTITLPLIGVLNVKGKTIGELQEMIRSRYDKDFLVNPQVSVLVLHYADRWVNVIGSVTKQGKVEFPDVRDLSIVDAIALAGGQTRLADMKHVSVKRRHANGEVEVIDVDVNAIMKENGAQRVLLEPGDVIFVPERML